MKSLSKSANGQILVSTVRTMFMTINFMISGVISEEGKERR